MSESIEVDFLKDFASNFRDQGLFSTSAKPVNYAGDLYNVTSSTKDPKKIPGHKGKSWKDILIDVGNLDDAAKCYVTNVKPDGKSSHPDFSVGGHMTPEESGVVPRGGKTYLMPLCYWHNNPARNEMAFEHDETAMVELSGFMEGDVVATFMMRQPSIEPFSAIYYDPSKESLETFDLNDASTLIQDLHGISENNKCEEIRNCLLVERSDKDDGIYYIKDAFFEE